MENREVRLIDANVFIKDLTAMKSAYDAIALDGMVKALKEAPTIDPESLRPHGKWLLEAHKESTNYRWNVTAECSNCCDEKKEIWAGFFPNVPDWLARDVALDSASSVKLSNYCPNCGAVMQGVKDE